MNNFEGLKLSELSITCFEDLSNEIFYEILDFLDTCDGYESFGDLNNRFRQFFHHFSCPYKINLDLTSKTIFQQRCQHIKTDNVHRIISLRFSNWIAMEYFLLSFSLDSSFVRLESLILNDIKPHKLIPLLLDLSSIPRLFSLSLTTIGTVNDPNTIHRLIFALPVLKYCNTAFKWRDESFTLSTSISETSSIEHFVSKSEYNLEILSVLLSYMPELVRLSIGGYLSLEISYDWKQITLNNLTYLHLKHSMSFDNFAMFISNLFHQLQVLRISSNSDNNYFDSKRWEQLISTHLPCLHTFDLQHFGKVFNEYEYYLVENQFNSLFWMERKWFFAHQYYRYKNDLYIFFYSQTSSSEKLNLKSIRHIVIHDNNTTISLCSSQLTLSTTDNLPGMLYIDELNQIIPFEQLRKLTTTSYNFNINHVMKLLHLSLNIQSLVLCAYSSSLQDRYNNNNIQQIIIHGRLTFKDIQELSIAYPDLKSLEMFIQENDLELIIRFLLKHNIGRNHWLTLVVIRDVHPVMINRLQKVIDREELAETYSIELLSDTAYIRW